MSWDPSIPGNRSSWSGTGASEPDKRTFFTFHNFHLPQRRVPTKFSQIIDYTIIVAFVLPARFYFLPKAPRSSIITELLNLTRYQSTMVMFDCYKAIEFSIVTRYCRAPCGDAVPRQRLAPEFGQDMGSLMAHSGLLQGTSFSTSILCQCVVSRVQTNRANNP